MNMEMVVNIISTMNTKITVIFQATVNLQYTFPHLSLHFSGESQ